MIWVQTAKYQTRPTSYPVPLTSGETSLIIPKGIQTEVKDPLRNTYYIFCCKSIFVSTQLDYNLKYEALDRTLCTTRFG